MSLAMANALFFSSPFFVSILAIIFLKEKVGAPTDNWVMCYPYGGYDNSVIEILKKKKCKLALADTSEKLTLLF